MISFIFVILVVFGVSAAHYGTIDVPYHSAIYFVAFLSITSGLIQYVIRVIISLLSRTNINWLYIGCKYDVNKQAVNNNWLSIGCEWAANK